MRQHQVPLPCVQEIAALRRKRVQPSFSDRREAGEGSSYCPSRLRRTHDLNTSARRYRSALLAFRVFLSFVFPSSVVSAQNGHTRMIRLTIQPAEEMIPGHHHAASDMKSGKVSAMKKVVCVGTGDIQDAGQLRCIQYQRKIFKRGIRAAILIHVISFLMLYSCGLFFEIVRLRLARPLHWLLSLPAFTPAGPRITEVSLSPIKVVAPADSRPAFVPWA